MSVITPPRGLSLPSPDLTEPIIEIVPDAPVEGPTAPTPSPTASTTSAPAPVQPKRVATPIIRSFDTGRAASSDDWRHSAVCRDHDPELWFGLNPADRRTAIRLCQSCPVAVECLWWALAANQRSGVWGAVDFEAMPTKAYRRMQKAAAGEPADPADAPTAEELAAADDSLRAEPKVLVRGRPSLVERVHAAREEMPGADLAKIAEMLGYASGDSLARTLQRQGHHDLVWKIRGKTPRPEDVARRGPRPKPAPAEPAPAEPVGAECDAAGTCSTTEPAPSTDGEATA